MPFFGSVPIEMYDKKIVESAEKIIKFYPKHHSYRDPFRVLISTLLSQRTKDENTERASQALFSAYEDVFALKGKNPECFYDLIKPAGMFRQKAERIAEISKIIVDEYKGEVPSDLESLLKLPGIGRKTANIVLYVSFGIPAMAVDTHVHRISNRIGWIATRKPDESEIELMECLPDYLWGPLNGSMVEFGKNTCKPRNPKCNVCEIKEDCKFYYYNGDNSD